MVLNSICHRSYVMCHPGMKKVFRRSFGGSCFAHMLLEQRSVCPSKQSLFLRAPPFRANRRLLPSTTFAKPPVALHNYWWGLRGDLTAEKNSAPATEGNPPECRTTRRRWYTRPKWLLWGTEGHRRRRVGNGRGNRGGGRARRDGAVGSEHAPWPFLLPPPLPGPTEGNKFA